MKYIIAIGIFQALIAIFMLHKNKLRSGADGILIFLLACIATHMFIKFVIFNFIGDMQVRMHLNTFIGFCYAPLLYLYTQKLRNPEFNAGKKWFVFIPFVLATIGYFSVISVLIAAPSAGYTMLNWYNKLTFYTLIPSDIFYTFLSLKIVKEVSKEQVREIKLVKQIAFAFILMSFIGSFFSVIANDGYELNILIRTVCYSILLLLCVIIIRYRFMMLQYGQYKNHQTLPIKIIAEQLTGSATSEIELDPLKTNTVDIRKPTLSNDEQAQVWLQLETQMKSSKMFTDGTLNLDKLASLTSINKYHISETLNDYAHKTFYQYINEYRIQFAVERMKYLTEKEVSINILSLAYDSGFNAKSSFNRYFKEIVHQTPSEYLKALQSATVADKYLNGALG